MARIMRRKICSLMGRASATTSVTDGSRTRARAGGASVRRGLRAILVAIATTLTGATPSSSEGSAALGAVSELRALVESEGACALPGVTIRYESFIPVMWQAVARGFVSHDKAVFVGEGLRWGFKAGIDISRLATVGHRWFSNYQSSIDGREAVSRATMKRVKSGKTLHLGAWSTTLAKAVKSLFSSSFIFPLGAVAKPLEPSELRPTDNHTRTGLNAATDLSFLKHSLDTYREIAWFLKLDHFMRVSDVDAAFPLLPLHPDVWSFFMFRFFGEAVSAAQGVGVRASAPAAAWRLAQLDDHIDCVIHCASRASASPSRPSPAPRPRR